MCRMHGKGEGCRASVVAGCPGREGEVKGRDNGIAVVLGNCT